MAITIYFLFLAWLEVTRPGYKETAAFAVLMLMAGLFAMASVLKEMLSD